MPCAVNGEKVRTCEAGAVVVVVDDVETDVVLWPAARVSETEVVAKAAALGVAVYGIAPYFLSAPRTNGFMLGYSRMKEGDIREGVRRLSQVL